MNLLHLPDGRSMGDTQVLVALTARPAAAVRKHCRRDEHGYDVQACTEQLAVVPDPILLTARQAEQYLGIPSGTVYSWASRSKSTGLRSLDHTDSGQPLYDVGDLLKLREGDAL